ncbi:LysR family transcriptional regulator [Methyloversatilis thermotolerans]|uniref:LysR family transcriptional regulator n=1 Tax=Methyloversatilis thermotolerans TaxID=1346290 RepID=UPI00037BAE3A|nr:LysR family transcriptional regulator [Methyloversatilis thermotolerans]
MNFSLDQLLAFQAAAESGSFSAAARRLGKAQSVVSTAIAHLEIDLGLSLFDRGGRYPRLTAEGERLLRDAQRILDDCRHLQALAGDLVGGTEARLTLAVDDESHLPWLDGLLADFAQQFPRVELELLFPLMDDLVHMLLEGRAQVGIGYEQIEPQRDITRHVLGRVSAPMVVAPAHPLARTSPVRREDLAHARQIALTARGQGTEGQPFQVSSQVWWVEGDPAVLELVRRGHGWAMVPDFLARGPLARGEIVEIHCEEPLALRCHSLELLWHRGRALGRAGQWMKAALLARGAALLAA